MLIKLAILISLFSPTTEILECTVKPLDDYGFVQTGDNPEYVCVNPDGYTDFIVIEDDAPVTLDIGDMMRVELRNDEVISQYRVKSLYNF